MRNFLFLFFLGVHFSDQSIAKVEGVIRFTTTVSCYIQVNTGDHYPSWHTGEGLIMFVSPPSSQVPS